MPKKQYLEAGQIVGTHGVRGEVRVYSWCDSPDVLTGLDTLYMDEGRKAVHAVIRTAAQKNIVLAKLEGVDTAAAAAALRDTVVWLNRDDIELPEGRYFVQDLIGAQVIDDADEKVYGVLTDVSGSGANDIYHVRTPAGEVLIPAIPDVIAGVDTAVSADTAMGVIRVRTDIVKGLFSDED